MASFFDFIKGSTEKVIVVANFFSANEKFQTLKYDKSHVFMFLSDVATKFHDVLKVVPNVIEVFGKDIAFLQTAVACFEKEMGAVIRNEACTGSADYYGYVSLMNGESAYFADAFYVTEIGRAEHAKEKLLNLWKTIPKDFRFYYNINGQSIATLEA